MSRCVLDALRGAPFAEAGLAGCEAVTTAGGAFGCGCALCWPSFATEALAVCEVVRATAEAGSSCPVADVPLLTGVGLAELKLRGGIGWTVFGVPCRLSVAATASAGRKGAPPSGSLCCGSGVTEATIGAAASHGLGVAGADLSAVCSANEVLPTDNCGSRRSGEATANRGASGAPNASCRSAPRADCASWRRAGDCRAWLVEEAVKAPEAGLSAISGSGGRK
jgi:hypothetical protein